MKIPVFSDITPYSALKVNRFFGGKRCLHHQGRSVIEARNQYEAGSKQLDLFFDSGDGGDIILRNVDRLSTEYTALYPRRKNSSK
jgi:hypothetical protein